MKRIFLIVLDSFGIGQAVDAEKFGDGGADTLGACVAAGLAVPFLTSSGLGNIDGVTALPRTMTPTAAYARLQERSMGKDTTIGHWEIAGVVSPSPLPTYPHGFPKEVLDAFSTACGRGVLCNRTYSGTQVIRDYGEEHMRSGKLIVYTSADSVFQIAAHEDVVPLETLYEYCRVARRILTGEHAVGRVIARPFVGDSVNGFTRTANRRDFSLLPPSPTLLDDIKAAGKEVIAIGKISDIFAEQGISVSYPSHSNTEGMALTEAQLKETFQGLCFTNLVDFDMLYGHRRDANGYARALEQFDTWLANFLATLEQDDLVMITADHGCDPAFVKTTDHTREDTPWMIFGPRVHPGKLGTLSGFSDIAATVAELLNVPYRGEGKSHAKKICDS